MNTKCNFVKIFVQGIPKWDKIFYSSTTFFKNLHSRAKDQDTHKDRWEEKIKLGGLALMILRLGIDLVSKTKISLCRETRTSSTCRWKVLI